MGLSPALAAISREAAVFAGDPYLLTVDADHRPHCTPTTVAWAGDDIVVRAPSKWSGSESSGHRDVSLLWTPAEPGGYSLIVDGVAAPAGDAGQLSVTPTRAVLHRPGVPTERSGPSCGSDCVPIFSAGAAPAT